MLRCNPISKAWHPTDSNYSGQCKNERPEIVKNAAWNIICDLTTAALPTVGVWRLQLNRSHKIGLTAVFALAIVVIATAAARIGVSVVADQRDGHVSAAYNGARTDLSFVESSLSIAVACAPTLRPIFASRFHLYTPPGQPNVKLGDLTSSRPRRSSLHGFESLPDSFHIRGDSQRNLKAPLVSAKDRDDMNVDDTRMGNDLILKERP